MFVDLLPRRWVVIDTNSYAGNFERTMGSFCTGVAGDTHGVLEAQAFTEQYRDDAYALLLGERVYVVNPDDTSHSEIATMWPTPPRNYHYNSVAIPFSVQPTIKDLKFIRERALEFARRARTGEFTEGIAQYVDSKLQILAVRSVKMTIDRKTLRELICKKP